MWFLPLLFLFFTNPIHAQDATNLAVPITTLFTQYKADYLYQYNLYQQAYSDYSDKKQINAKYGTAATQNDEFLAAISTINARNQMFKSYLMALRVSLEDYKSADPTSTQTIQTDLSNWENWFDQQSTVVSAINNTHDLQAWVKVFQSKYNQIQLSIYTALVQNEVNLRQLTLNQVQSLAVDIQNSPQVKPDSQQWLQSLSDKTKLVSTNLNAALALTKKTQLSDRFSNFYPNAQSNLSLSQKYLTAISGDLKSVISNFYQL
jgi:hypothetical protein